MEWRSGTSTLSSELMTMFAASINTPEQHATQSPVSPLATSAASILLIGTWLMKDCGSKLTTRPCGAALMANASAWFLLVKAAELQRWRYQCAGTCQTAVSASLQRTLYCRRRPQQHCSRHPSAQSGTHSKGLAEQAWLLAGVRQRTCRAL